MRRFLKFWFFAILRGSKSKVVSKWGKFQWLRDIWPHFGRKKDRATTCMKMSKIYFLWLDPPLPLIIIGSGFGNYIKWKMSEALHIHQKKLNLNKQKGSVALQLYKWFHDMLYLYLTYMWHHLSFIFFCLFIFIFHLPFILWHSMQL